jgi:hypothetical protein
VRVDVREQRRRGALFEVAIADDEPRAKATAAERAQQIVVLGGRGKVAGQEEIKPAVGTEERRAR